MQYITDDAGVVRMLGTILPISTLSYAPTAEGVVRELSDGDIIELAKSQSIRFEDDSWIKDQKSHGSCNGFAAAMALSRARVASGLPRVDLSGAYVYSKINGGRDQGSMLDDGMEQLIKGGACKDTTVTWDQIYPRDYNIAQADNEAAQYKAFECYHATTSRLWYSGLALGFIGVCAVHVGNSFMRVDGDGIAGVDRGPGNHAVGVEGLAHINGKLVERGFNSWNLTYGIRGRMGMTWEHHAQTFNYHAHYLIRATVVPEV